MSHNNAKQNKIGEKSVTQDKPENDNRDRPNVPKSSNACKGSFSENNIKKQDKEIKDKTVVSVKSWNCREMHEETNQLPGNVEKDLAIGMERVAISDTQDDFVANPNLLRARDSLEDLLKNDEQTSPRMNSKPNTSRATREKILPESNKSSPALGESKKPSSVAKVLAWDPFDKVSRKCKENKRKKLNKKLESPRLLNNHIEPAIKSTSNIDHKIGDEVPEPNGTSENSSENFDCVYDYKFQPKNTKSVVFTNEVMVVYFNGENVVSEAKEPLKRELEQQVRNKEMRRGHLMKMQENCNICLF